MYKKMENLHLIFNMVLRNRKTMNCNMLEFSIPIFVAIFKHFYLL